MMASSNLGLHEHKGNSVILTSIISLCLLARFVLPLAIKVCSKMQQIPGSGELGEGAIGGSKDYLADSPGWTSWQGVFTRPPTLPPALLLP